MTEKVDIFKIINQLGEKMRTEDEKESFRIVLESFFNCFFGGNFESEGENNLFENFLVNFNRLKGLVGNDPERIEVKAFNERGNIFKNLVVDLMLEDQRITNLGKALSKKRLVVPTGYDAARSDFSAYRVIILKVGRRTIKSCLEKVDSIANENDIKILSLFHDVLKEEKFYGFEPDFEWLYQRLQDYADDYEAGDERREPYKHALESLEFLEAKVIGSALSTLCDRWEKTPHVLIPRHVASKNPEILIKLYDEAVRTYVSGNYWACIVTCRSLFEHILIKYYGASKNDNLAKIISWSEGKYNSLPGLNLHEKRNKAKEIVHEYNGEDIEGKTALSFIKTVQSLIERIPATTLIL